MCLKVRRTLILIAPGKARGQVNGANLPNPGGVEYDGNFFW